MEDISPSSSKNTSATGLLVYLDKCEVCGKPASKKCGGCSLAFYCGLPHQRVDWPRHKADCKPYELVREESDEGGGGKQHLVATKLVTTDTIIISEYPLITFEDSINHADDSLQKLLEVAEECPVKCFGCNVGWVSGGGGVGTLCTNERDGDDLYRCLKCGLPVCSLDCSESVSKSRKHADGDCKIIQDINKKETRSSTEIWRIPRDLRILRLIYKEKQKGTPISLKNTGGSITWGPLVKQVKGLKNSYGKEEDIRKQFPLSLAATGGNADGVEVVRLLNILLMEFSLPVDPENKQKRALFEKHCFLSHSCCPNTEWWLDTSGYHIKLLVRVIKPVLPGERLTIFQSFDPTLIHNPTILRRQKLQKQVLPSSPCECERCVDPTELGTCISGIRCTVCKDISATLTCNYYYPSNPLEKRPAWSCSGKNCRSTKTFEQILVVTMKAEKELEQIWKCAVMVPASGGSQIESVITKLQTFIVKHQRKILHPNHYLIMIARSRINRVVSHFLGTGEKLFLCVTTNQPRAYDYGTYKVEYLHSYLGFLTKLNDIGNSRNTGKLRYELVFCEAALLFRDFQEERMGGASFFRRLHGIMDNLSKCQKSLMCYHDCKASMDSIKRFSQMFKKLFGADFLSSYRVKMLQSNSTHEENIRDNVKKAISNWKNACEKIEFKKLYMNPSSSIPKDGETGVSNEDVITKEDLQAILMDIAPTQ